MNDTTTKQFWNLTTWMSVSALVLALGITSVPHAVVAKDLDDQFMVLMAARNAAKAQKHEMAIARYQKLLKMPGTHVKARSELGWELLKVGKYQEGQRQFEAVLKVDPKNPNALRGRLEGVRKTNNPKAEYEVLAQLVKLSPKDRELRKQLAVALHNQGKYDEAEKHLSILMGEK